MNGSRPVPIGEMRSRDDAERRRQHLDRGQKADLLRIRTDVVHGVDNHPGEGNPLAEADENVAQEQTS